MDEPAIDVIDIGPYLGCNPAGTRHVVRAVRATCERIGFLVISGHGVADAVVRRVFDVSMAFFDLPLAEKLAVRSDDAGIPRGYSALASKSLGRTYGLDTPPDLREQFFIGPNYDAQVACLPTCTDADHPPRYAPILAGEHMLAKLERREARAAV